MHEQLFPLLFSAFQFIRLLLNAESELWQYRGQSPLQKGLKKKKKSYFQRQPISTPRTPAEIAVLISKIIIDYCLSFGPFLYS